MKAFIYISAKLNRKPAHIKIIYQVPLSVTLTDICRQYYVSLSISVQLFTDNKDTFSEDTALYNYILYLKKLTN